MIWRTCVNFILLHVVYAQIYEGRYEGDNCMLDNNEKGKCVRLSQCGSAIEKVLRREHPVTCVYIRFTPIVCCPTTETLLKRISVQKCLSYQKAKLKPTEDPPTPLDINQQATEKTYINPDIVPLTLLRSDLYPDELNKNFTSDAVDDSDILKVDTAVRRKDSTSTADDFDIPAMWSFTGDFGTILLAPNEDKDKAAPLDITLSNDSYSTKCETLCNILKEYNLNLTEYKPISVTDLPSRANFPSTTEESLSSTINVALSMTEAELSSTTEEVLSTITEFSRKTIVLGFKTKNDEFPHMAALGYSINDELLWRCGGSLVSEKFVLTAAHCLFSTELGEVQWVSLGSNFINLASNSTPYMQQQIYKITRRIPHPLFKRPASYNDIALLELDRTVEFTTSIRPACLPSSLELDPKVQLQATGWGLTQYGGDASESLQKVNLDVFSEGECAKIYEDIKGSRRLNIGIAEEQFCAGGKEGEQDTCNGDSGGPLQLKTDDSNGPTYTILGITSFGKACGFQGVPGVYTKVSKYVSWLENIIWPNEF